MRATAEAGVQHFIYVSVAQPAPVMKAYIQVRAECEAMIRQSGMKVTLEQMTRALVDAVENPCRGVRIIGVPEIRVPGGLSKAETVSIG